MENNSSQLYYITVTSPELKTLWDFTHDINSPAFQYAGKETEFLNVADEFGLTNRARIILCYSEYERNKYKDIADKDLPLVIGTRLMVPVDKVERNGLLTQGLQVVSNNDVAFKAASLAEIEADKGYVHITKPIEGQELKGTLKEVAPEHTVWIWCRALSGRYDNEMKGQIFDVTPFVQSITTNMSKMGGSFTVSLPPLVCEQLSDGTWTIENGSMLQYLDTKGTSLAGQGYVAEASLYDKNMDRNQFLFHNIIGTNDLVFIRFETLQLEEKDRFNNQDGNLFIDKNQLPGKIYDMIGLVDVNASSLNPNGNDGNIAIAGRDLSKLFIEDGTYFYALEQSADGKMNFAGSASAKNGMLQRLLSDGQLLYFNLWNNTSIEKAFAFVLNQLVNIKIVPDDLFSGYDSRSSKSKRNKKFKLQSTEVYKGKPKNEVVQGFYNNGITEIKQMRSLNGLTAATPSEEDAAAVKIFDDVKSFLEAIRKNHVRVTIGKNTSGWNAFTWLSPNGVPESVSANRFPLYFDGKLYKESDTISGTISNSATLDEIFYNVDSYIDVRNSTSKFTESYNEELASGIWQIIKLVIDKGVTNRRVVDASLSTAQGSIMNFFRKICQQPFVEYFGDTYGDTYNLTVRKPPTDQIGLISLLEGKVETEDGRMVNGTPVVIDIEDYDVLSEDLYFDDKDIVSWYHLCPKYNTGGSSDGYPYFYLPALFFEEYSDIWGSRPMDLSSNYMPYLPLDPKAKESDLDLSQKQAVHDLKFMVDSNMANPFMRKGTLRLNGDRRIKVGNILRYKPTGEIFAIDAVQQSGRISEDSIDRITTVSVSRGMVEQLIYGVPYISSKNQELDHISYFNIINTTLSTKFTKGSDLFHIFSNFKVNKHVFEFFLRKEQFARRYKPSQVNRTIYKSDVKAVLG